LAAEEEIDSMMKRQRFRDGKEISEQESKANAGRERKKGGDNGAQTDCRNRVRHSRAEKQ
jgi:hypothetical protein